MDAPIRFPQNPVETQARTFLAHITALEGAESMLGMVNQQAGYNPHHKFQPAPILPRALIHMQPEPR